MTQELSQWSLLMLMACSLAVGFSFGALYDIFRIRRRATQRKRKQKKLLTRIIEGIIIGVEDVVFFLVLGCVTCVMYYVFSNGRVRLLALVFELLTIVSYPKTFINPLAASLYVKEDVGLTFLKFSTTEGSA